MQSAAKRKTPAVGKTPSTIGMTPAANNLSNRQKIEEVCTLYNMYYLILKNLLWKNL